MLKQSLIYSLGIVLIASLMACAGSKKDSEEPNTTVTTAEIAPPDETMVEPVAITVVGLTQEIRDACQVGMVANTDLHFDFDETRLEPEHNRELEAVAECLKAGDLVDASIVVVGYADAVGADEVNDEVAEERATSVANYLYSRGVAKERVVIESKGEDKAVLPASASETAREIDRRVELMVMR